MRAGEKKSPVRILLVEDNPGDRDLIRIYLDECANPYLLRGTGKLSEAQALLDEEIFDLVMLDLGLPDSQGLETLEAIRLRWPGMPVIVLTGLADQQVGLDAVARGAQDYLLKGEVDGPILCRCISYAIERQRIHAELVASEKAYRALAVNLPGMVYRVHLEDPPRMEFFNDMAEQITGYRLEELQHGDVCSIDPLIVEDDRLAVTDRVKQSLDSKEPFQVEYRIRHKDGSLRYLLERGRTVLGEAGQPMSIDGVILDFSERHKVEQRLEQALLETRQREVQLAQSDRLASVGTLAAGVAHEINNPLAYVLFNLESLREDLPHIISSLLRICDAWSDLDGLDAACPPDDPARDPVMLQDVVDRVRESCQGAERIRDIVRDLKTFARSEDDLVQPTSVNKAMELAINMAFNQIKYRATLVKELDDLPKVMANDGRLTQVFVNLLVNSAQAIEEGRVDVNRITVRTWAGDGRVYCEIRDTGCGIPRDMLGKVFDPFFTTKPVGVGSGLGLPICHNLISAMGGSLELESEVGRGTRCLLNLPALTDKAAAEPEAEREPAPELDPGQDPVQGGGRILVIDDEALVCASLRRALRRNHQVLVANGGVQAREILERDRAFDLILCDLMMPDISGMELFEWLEQEDASLAQRVVFVTGGAFTPRAAAFLEKTNNPRIDKPFQPDALRLAVGELLQTAKT